MARFTTRACRVGRRSGASSVRSGGWVGGGAAGVPAASHNSRVVSTKLEIAFVCITVSKPSSVIVWRGGGSVIAAA